jgi:hypothetical protein
MKKLFLFLVFFLGCVNSTLAQVPNCSNVVDQTEPNTAAFSNSGYLQMYLPNPAGAGNAVIVFATASNGDTITVTDDKSDSYSVAASHLNNNFVYLFYALNVTAGARQIRINYPSSDAWVTGFAFECTNVATSSALDKAVSNSGSSATITAGSSGTLGASGDLVIQAYWNDSTQFGCGSVRAGSQSNISWALIQADRSMCLGAQWGMYSSTAALNPTMSSATAGFNSVAIFLKAVAAGTPFPTDGIGITCMKTFWISPGYPGGQDSLPRTEQFPCPGSLNNAVIVTWNGGETGVLSGVADSNGNSYSSTGAAVCGGNGGGCNHTFYTQGATLTNSQTLTFSGINGNDSAKIYIVRNGSTSSFFDKTVTAIGSQSGSGSFSTVTITPSTPNGLVIGEIGVASDTIIGTVGPGQLFTSCFWSSESAGFGGCDENNGWAYYLNPNTSSVTFTWTDTFGVPNGWVSRADAFESAVATGSAPAPPTQLRATVQ